MNLTVFKHHRVNRTMIEEVSPLESSNSFLAATSDDLVEDDGSVYTEENGIRVNIRHGELVRTCGAIEILAIKGGKYNLSNTVMPIWLESKEKMKMQDVLEALWIVSRNVPHLQFCHSKRNGKIWYKRMAKLDIDLETTTQNMTEVHHDMLDTSFDIWKGPLWKVRLITADDKTINNKYSSILFLVIFHSINDGITNMKIAREFVSAMNQLTSGKSVTPKFSPVIMPGDRLVKAKTSIAFLTKRFFTRSFSIMMNILSNEFYFSGSIPIPNTKVAKTKVLMDQFTENETKEILKMCKDEGVTVNSFISTVTNIALLTVAQSRSKVPIGRRKIVTTQALNLRRYYESRYSDIPGYNSAVADYVLTTSLSDSNNFWLAARNINSTFKNEIDVKQDHRKIFLFYPLISNLIFINNLLCRQGLKCVLMSHYSISNMGNLDKLLPEAKENDNFEITNLIRSVSLQLCGTPFLLQFQTFRNRLSLTMDYFTPFTTDETASEIFALLYKFIRNMINHKCLYESN